VAKRGVILLAIAVTAVNRFATAADSSYAGSKACSQCHPRQFEQQSGTGHAGSLARADAHGQAGQYLPLIQGIRPPPDWAFGGGIQAITFVSRIGFEQYLEHRSSFYRSTGRLGITPGHDDVPEPGVRYPVFSATGAILRCFLCHSTGTPRVEEGAIVPQEPGVRCETCHGPGAEHAARPSLGNIVRPSRYTAAEMNQACGSCHRKPAAKGDDTDFGNAWNARHQPLYLAQSKCFIKSEGKLKCTTCHPPHGGPTRSVCGGCHSKPRHRAAIRPASRSCETCHMPVVRPKAELGFANHWIGVYASGAPLRPLIAR
jgi:hypothetical protein